MQFHRITFTESPLPLLKSGLCLSIISFTHFCFVYFYLPPPHYFLLKQKREKDEYSGRDWEQHVCITTTFGSLLHPFLLSHQYCLHKTAAGREENNSQLIRTSAGCVGFVFIWVNFLISFKLYREICLPLSQMQIVSFSYLDAHIFFLVVIEFEE